MTIKTIKKGLSPDGFEPSGGYVALIDKPENWTSFDVCKKIRGITGFKKVGHGGTLDPFATGLLIVGIGKGTRVLEQMSRADKGYRATITFGRASDSYDRTGTITAEAPWHGLTADALEKALKKMSGEIEQTPPMFSAKKIKGQKLYNLARKGITVERKAVKVNVQVEVITWKPPELELMLDVSKGTYIRSYAHDLGQLLGVPALLSELRRTRVDTLLVEDSMLIDEFEQFWKKMDH